MLLSAVAAVGRQTKSSVPPAAVFPDWVALPALTDVTLFGSYHW